MILFPRVSSMSRIFFCFSCFVYDSSLRFFSFFLWFNFFKWYTREEVTNEISYLLEMKRV